MVVNYAYKQFKKFNVTQIECNNTLFFVNLSLIAFFLQYEHNINRMSSTTVDYNSFFKFTGSSGEYIISNVATSDYVLLSIGWSTSLTISTIDSNSATEFDVSYSSSVFRISIDRGWRTYYWNLDSNCY